jgi:hypothetical protein
MPFLQAVAFKHPVEGKRMVEGGWVLGKVAGKEDRGFFWWQGHPGSTALCADFFFWLSYQW